MPAERVTVMGMGNPLLRDEGVGVRVVESLMAALEFPDNVKVLDVGTMGMSILHLFRECDYMLVVDAVDGTGEEPGTIVRLSPEEMAPNQVMHSLHDIRFVDVLQAAMLIGATPKAECIGIQIEDMTTFEIGLTPGVEASVPAAAAAVLEVLGEHGVHPTPRVGDSADAQVLEAIRTFSKGPRRT